MLLEILEKSLGKAFDKHPNSISSTDRSLHSARSKTWVTNIAKALREKYDKPEYRVFSADCTDNRTEFKLNELLFDISVVRVRPIPSASKNKQLMCVTSMEWAIESEFQRNDSRASIIDFSKLVMARSSNKLLILPQSKNIRDWALSTLSDAVPEDGDKYFLAIVPHPESWADNMNVELYVLGERGWEIQTN